VLLQEEHEVLRGDADALVDGEEQLHEGLGEGVSVVE